MKHTIKITLILMCIFLLSQLMGLAIINQYYGLNTEGEIEYEALPMGIERPEVAEGLSWLYIFIAVIIGTLLLLFLIKIGSRYITKAWFFLAILIALILAFSAFIDQRIAIIMAVLLALWKVFWPNVYVHNFTEIFLYGGIAVLFHEMLSVKVTVILLIAISIYDIIAVNKIKHMVKIAKYQAEQNFFAGAMIPYTTAVNSIRKASKKAPKTKKKSKSRILVKTAILGGGDMAFPLFFAGAIMKEFGVLYALIPIITTTIALGYLLFTAEKKKFYPAMPYLSAGSLIGIVIVLLI